MAKPDAKQPFSKWYWSDWRGDPKLKLCSLAARGLWMDMLALMHEAEPYGHLLVEGVMPDSDGLAAICGRPVKEVRAAIAELEKWKVFSRNEDGVLFSRRMVRDRQKAEQDKANGRKGGNPRITAKDKPDDNATDNGGVNPQGNPHGISQIPEAIAIVREDIQSTTTTETIPDTARATSDSPGGGDGKPSNADLIKSAEPDLLEQARTLRDALEKRLNLGTPIVSAPIVGWLKAGATPELINATIDDVLASKPGFKPSTIAYFGPAMDRAINAKQHPAQEAKTAKFNPVEFIQKGGKAA